MNQELMKPYQARNVNAELGIIQAQQWNNLHLPHLFPTEYHSPHSLGLSDLAFLAQAQPAEAAVGGWVELDRTTLGSPGDDITVSGLADKRYYMVLVDKQTTGNSDGNIRLGNGTADAGNNYAQRLNNNGGTDAIGTGIAQIQADLGGRNTPAFAVGYLGNISADEKLWLSHAVGQSTAGSGVAPERSENVGKHAQTSNPNDVIQVHNINAGSFNTGAQCVVLEWSPEDVHTTNFWELLDSTDFSGSAGSFTSGTFTAKKYLWVQCYLEGTSSMRGFDVQFNSDTGTNYAIRRSNNGAADATFANTSAIQAAGSLSLTNIFWNMFILNNSTQNKLCSVHSVSVATQGAGTAPIRDELAGKWVNASQITSITVRSGDTGNITTGKLRVYGAN